MLWKRFEIDRAFLDMYPTPPYEPGSGYTDPQAIREAVLAIDDAMAGQPHPIIKARAFAFVLLHCALYVNPKCWFGVHIAGLCFGSAPNGSRNQTNKGQPEKPLSGLCDRWKRQLSCPEEVKAALADLWDTGTGICYADYSHSVPDWDAVLRYGFPGLKRRAREARDAREAAGMLTDDMRIYFESIDITYEALIRFLLRLADVARLHIADDPRMPLREVCFRALAERAPQNSYEAMQLIYLFHLVQQYVETAQARSLGDLDRLLYPFFLKDTHSGAFDDAQIKELLKYWLIQYDFQRHAYNQPFSLGGTDRYGKPVPNELSNLILDAYEEADILNVKLQIVTAENTPDAFLKRICRMIRDGHGSFVFMNERVGVRSMSKARGESFAPHDLGTWGCYTFNIKGGITDAIQGRLNLAKPLELALNDGIDPMSGKRLGIRTGDIASMADYGTFEAAYFAQLDALLARVMKGSNYYDEHILTINPSPMCSATLSYSVDRAVDCFTVGMTAIICSFVGSAADELAMIRKYVFEEKRLTLTALRDLLREDWHGGEMLRLEIRKDPMKYGNNDDRVDLLAVRIVDHLKARLAGEPNKRNAFFELGLTSIDFNIRFGEHTGATPEGRRAGEPLSKNLGATSGQDRKGLTALIQTVAKLDAIASPGGASLDFLLHPSAVQGEEGLDAMLAMVRTFMALGGCTLQGNVVDADTLRAAQADPDAYRNLQVRVTGWNWYFTDMTPQYQDELIHRLTDA